MIYDCIPFFNELDILKLRMQILAPYVDRFVLEEASVTFSGEKKEMLFSKNREMFREFEDKIIYIADYIEPGRKELPNMAEVRRLAFSDIDDCLYRILSDSLEYLNSKNEPIDPMTEKTFLYYQSKREGEEVPYGSD